MDNKTYNVTVYTPLGNKSGTVELTVEKDTLHGALTLLGHTQPLQGVVDADGVCCMHGSIITIARTLPFTATGKISKTDISLLLSGEHSVFRLTGTAQPDRTPTV